MGKNEMMRDMRIIISLAYGAILDIGSEISLPACVCVRGYCGGARLQVDGKEQWMLKERRCLN